MRIYSRLRKYIEYLHSSYHKATMPKTKGTLLRYAFANLEFRGSLTGEVIRIRLVGTFRPTRVRLILGKTELLLRTDIFKNLDLAVNLGGGSIHGWAK